MRPAGGYRGDELLAQRFLRRPALIYPLLLPQTKLIIGGEAKQHKSFILHSLIWALATGQPAFGQPLFSVPQPVPGILFSQELTETVLQQRWAKHSTYNAMSSELFLRNTYTVPKGGYALDHEKKRAALWEHIAYWAHVLGRQPAWIAFDPISKFHSKQENKQEEVMAVLQVIDEIQLRTGAGVIFCHHHGVMTQDKATYRSGGGLLRGSSQWHGDVDAILTVKKSKTIEHAISIELRHEEEMPDFVVRLRKDSLLFEFVRWAEPPELSEEKELT
jgi:RecA-family ATPase